LERVEILESVNGAAGNWTNVVDARTGCTCKSHYSESVVFSLQIGVCIWCWHLNSLC
jgi:hypothetical protein